MKKIMDKAMISCECAGQLIEKKQEMKLSLADRVKLKFHLMMCSICRTYEKQSMLLGEWLKQQSEFPSSKALDKLKRKIKEKFDDE